MEKSMNPSSRRSRQWITKALLELMMEKPFNKITITEIADKADVVRRTFYRNFDSKEDILRTYIYSIFLGYEERLSELKEYNPYKISKIYFEYMSRHKTFLKLLVDNDLFLLILRVSEDHIEEFSKKIKGPIIKDYSETFLEYFNAYNVSGMWQMLENWLNKGMLESVDELAHIYEQIVLGDPHHRLKENNK